MRKIISVIAALTVVASICPTVGFSQEGGTAEVSEWKYGLGSDKGFNEDTYTAITRNEYSKNNVNQWRDGSMTGNGMMGVIESCDPAEDVFIFNNTKFVLATNEVREVADISGNLETIRKNVVNKSGQGAWTSWVTSWRNDNYGSNGLSSNTFMYHPAAELRVKNNAYSSNDKYNRYTDWETGEIGMQWKKSDAEYNSRTFVSRPDNVAVTIIEAPEGGELNLTLSVDNLLEMNIDSAGLKNKGIVEAPQSKEIITKDDNGYTIGQIVKYGDFNIGTSDTPNEFAHTGYATATRILTDGSITTEVQTENKTINKYFNTDDSSQTFETEITTPYLTITGTDKVMLVTRAERQDDGNNFVDVAQAQTDEQGITTAASVPFFASLTSEIDNVLNMSEVSGNTTELISLEKNNGNAKAVIRNNSSETKTVSLYAANYNDNKTLSAVKCVSKDIEAGQTADAEISDSIIGTETRLFVWEGMKPIPEAAEDAGEPVSLCGLYDDLLARHSEGEDGQRATFNSFSVDFDGDSADRAMTNTDLQAKQNESSEINAAWLERLYNNGRFALICASGYNTTRLGGIWTGSWMPDWSGDFTQDANVNLQVSSMNVSSLKSASHSYITYILRQVSDWEVNAKNVYGIENAVMAGPRTDGDGNGQIYHSLAGYPFLYWNTGADWLILPIYEYWQCYGNEKIPVGEDVYFEELTGVLDLSDSDVERIKAEGFDLEQDILKPLITKLYNFWKGYCSENCYMTEDGTIHMYDGTTMDTSAGDKYIFAPGYSPENVPSESGSGYNNSPSLTYNATMDVSAAHDSMTMLRQLIADGIITDIADADVDALENAFPEYITSDDGALKEWLSPQLEEHNNHRHVSHTYSAWPGYEAFDNDTLKDAVANALDMRYNYNLTDYAQAHGHLHNAMVEARVGRSANYAEQLRYLIANSYQYSALMTSHNHRHGSAFCTDNACGLCGVVNEGLVYSDTGVIELLPTLADSLKKGSITGMTARTQAEINELSWDIENKTVKAVITSTKSGENNIRLSCGIAWTNAAVSGCEYSVNGSEIALSMNKGDKAEIVFTLGEITDGTYELQNGERYLSCESYAENAAASDSDKAELWNISVSGNKIKIVSQMSGRTLMADKTLVRGGESEFDLTNNTVQIGGTVYTLCRTATKNTGVVADSFNIKVSESDDAKDVIADGGEVNTGQTVKLTADNFQPAKAKINDVEWFVEAKDGSELTYTTIVNNKDYSSNKTWHSDALLTIGTDALGKKLAVYAKTPDGSCESTNRIEINVAAQETMTVSRECESFEYGFGSYKLETGSAYSDGAAVGTINGKAVLKYKDVDFDNLLSLTVARNSYTNAAKVTAYYDLTESIANSAVYWDDYAKNSGEGTGAAARRYTFDEIALNDANKLSDTVSVADGSVNAVLSNSAKPSGKHDLYILIENNGGTWAGNYDTLSLTYAVETTEKSIEAENLTYGFGNFKNEGTNIGTINNKAVLKYSDVDFNNLYSVVIVKTSVASDGYITLYRDLDEATEKTLYTYDKDTEERDYRYKLDDVTIDSGKAISSRIQIVSGKEEITVPITNMGAGTGNLYLYLEKNTTNWWGNIDSIKLKYKNN